MLRTLGSAWQKHFGQKVALDSSSLCLTDSSLCDSDHFIGRNTNPMCAPNAQSLHLSVSVLTVDVLLTSPIILCVFEIMFGLRYLRCREHGMRRHNKISIAQSLRALKLPNCRCLAALNINILTADAIWPGPRQNWQIWRDWNNNSNNVNKFQCRWFWNASSNF